MKWSGEGQAGHYPFGIDTDRDGRDEFVIGYALWKAGEAVWSHDTALKDHPDGISAGSFGADPGAPPRVYICGSDEGFLIAAAEPGLQRFQLPRACIPAWLGIAEEAASLTTN